MRSTWPNYPKTLSILTPSSLLEENMPRRNGLEMLQKVLICLQGLVHSYAYVRRCCCYLLTFKMPCFVQNAARKKSKHDDFVPAPPGSLQNKYSHQLSQLRSMGFPNEHLNLRILDKVRGEYFP